MVCWRKTSIQADWVRIQYRDSSLMLIGPRYKTNWAILWSPFYWIILTITSWAQTETHVPTTWPSSFLLQYLLAPLCAPQPIEHSLQAFRLNALASFRRVEFERLSLLSFPDHGGRSFLQQYLSRWSWRNCECVFFATFCSLSN